MGHAFVPVSTSVIRLPMRQYESITGSMSRIMTKLSAADGPCWPELHRLQITTDNVMLFGLKRIVARVNSLSVSSPIQKKALISVGEMSGRRIRKMISRRLAPHTSAASSSSSLTAMMAELATLVPKLKRWIICTPTKRVSVP